MKNGLRIMDSDMHIVEPADLCLLEEKVITKPVDTRNLVDTSILEEVLKASRK